MALTLTEIPWADPVLAVKDDPGWAAEVVRAIGFDVPAFRYASGWVGRAKLHFVQARARRLSTKLSFLTLLVTSQENSCRFCYGAARASLKLLGLDDAQLERIERDVRISGADENERAILDFCRNLSRSSPRPARSQFEGLVARGLDSMAMNEVAMNVGAACFNNRVATFLAVPLDAGTESYSPGAVTRLMHRMLPSRYPRPLDPIARSSDDGPFAEIVRLVDGTEGALVLGEALRNAFASPVLPARTKAWIFSVVARSLGCSICDRSSAQILAREGVPADVRERILASLGSPEMDRTEAVLLPWVRETVHYKTDVMQRKTRELRAQVGDDVTLEAIGVAALANACARLGMLAQ